MTHQREFIFESAKGKITWRHIIYVERGLGKCFVLWFICSSEKMTNVGTYRKLRLFDHWRQILQTVESAQFLLEISFPTDKNEDGQVIQLNKFRFFILARPYRHLMKGQTNNSLKASPVCFWSLQTYLLGELFSETCTPQSMCFWEILRGFCFQDVKM